MNNITTKWSTLREAVAQATVRVSTPQTIALINDKEIPKGDIFEFSRAAGLLALKKTADVIPDCHPLPIESAIITYAIDGLNIIINVRVTSIYKTGVEVEAMHAAAITAITIYDMLKPVDKHTEIHAIRLLEKTGGKSDFKPLPHSIIKAAVIVCSDRISSGVGEDRAGKIIIEKIAPYGVETALYLVIPDDFDTIQQTALQVSEANYDLLIFTGGTGLSPRDVTPDAVGPLLDRIIPGIMEAARAYGQQRTPYSMLSRGVAGFIKRTLTLTLPGSKKAAAESIDALFPYILHLFGQDRH